MITVEPTRYTVRGLPEDDVNSSIWALTIERRGPDSWAVCHLSRCWNRRSRQFEYEPLPSSRTDTYKRTHRFTLEEATKIAVRQLPKLVINGMRVADGVLVDHTGAAVSEWVRADETSQ